MRHTLTTRTGICVLAALSLMACRVRATKTETAKPKHVFGRTWVQPAAKLDACMDGKEHPEAVAYLRSVANWIMARNPKTFSGEYSPWKFCFAVVNIPGVNASANAGNGLITIRGDLLRISAEGDAPIAAIIAHELAHVTMQHRKRIPVAEDLPRDLDPAELTRRLDAQKAWRAKIDAGRTSIIENAVNSKFLETVSLVIRDRSVWQRIKPMLGSLDEEQFKMATDSFTRMGVPLASSLSDPLKDKIATWRLLDSISASLEDLSSSAPGFANFITTPENCQATDLCQDRKIFSFLYNYSHTQLRPSMDKTCEERLAPADDPQTYAPYVQWMEQQADEVGFELYLRAGFLPASYTTFLETMMKGDEKFDTCVESLKKPGWRAPRITDDFVDGHPPHCFRYQNIAVSEMMAHQKDYEQLISKATTVAIPGLEEKRLAARKSVGTEGIH